MRPVFCEANSLSILCPPEPIDSLEESITSPIAYAATPAISVAKAAVLSAVFPIALGPDLKASFMDSAPRPRSSATP